MNKKTFLNLFLIFSIFLILTSILVNTISSYPFILADKKDLKFKEEVGYISFTEGKKYPGHILFKYNKNTSDAYISCETPDSNYVSYSNCKAIEQLRELKKKTGKGYWFKAKANIAKVNFGFLSFALPDLFISNNIQILD